MTWFLVMILPLLLVVLAIGIMFGWAGYGREDQDLR